MAWFDWEDREAADQRRRDEFRRLADERRREAEEARQKKLAAERAYQPPVRPKLTGLETRQRPQVPLLGGPPTTREAFEARPQLQTPLKAFSLEELKGTPRAIGETLALERGAPSWARKAYEETALGTVAGGPTAFGFSPEAIPLLEPLGYGLMKLGPVGKGIEAAPGRAIRGGKAAVQEFHNLLAERVPGAARGGKAAVAEFRRLVGQEAGAVGPLGRAGEGQEFLGLDVANWRKPKSFYREMESPVVTRDNRWGAIKRINTEKGTVTLRMAAVEGNPETLTLALNDVRLIPTKRIADVRAAIEAAQAPIGARVTPPEAAAPEQLVRLVNDVPELELITPRIAELKQALAKPRIKGRPGLERELARLEAQRDVARMSQPAEFEEAGTRLDNMVAELDKVEIELATRQRGAALQELPPARAPQFGTQERADWLAARGTRAKYQRPSTGYEQYSTPWLEERRGVLSEFVENAKFEPVAPEEALVGRARFTPGERPIETAGPMFERPITTPAAGVRAGAEPPAGARPPSAGGFAEYEAGQAEADALDRLNTVGAESKAASDEGLKTFTGGRQPPTGGKPPTTVGPSSDDILDYTLGAPPDEKIQRTLIRRYEGQVTVELDEADVAFRNLNWQASKGGIKLGRQGTPDMKRLLDAFEYRGRIEEAVAGLSPQEAEYIKGLRAIRDTETARMLRDIPDFEPLEFYVPHEFKTPKRPVRAPGVKLGQKPGFMRHRKLEGTISEILSERPDLELVTWNPSEIMQRRVYTGTLYRQQFTLLNHMKRNELAVLRSKAPTEGWRTPKNVRAFEPRPVPGKPDVYTQPWVVPDDIAKAIEDHFSPSLFSSNTPLRVLREGIATAKFVKTFGGLFQHIDYSMRVAALATKYRDVSMLGTIPKAIARGYVPGLDAKMRVWDMANPTRKALLSHGINVQAGMDFMGREYEQLAKDLTLYRINIVGKALKAFGSGTFRNAHREFMLDTGEKIVKNRVAGGMTLDQAAAKTALDLNETFSALPNWQSVLRNPTTRDLVRTLAFSMAEQESWLRIPFRQKGFFAAILLSTAALSNMVNLATTGKPLPLDAYKPFKFDKNDRNDMPFVEFNFRFLRPEAPYSGPLGQKEYIDLLGQADTPLRFLGAPKFAIQSRLGQLPSTAVQILQGRESFGGKPMKGPKDIGLFVAEQASPIPAAGFWGEQERIGTPGAVVQATGLNISAESTMNLLKRLVPGYETMTPAQRDEAAAANPQVAAARQQQLQRGLERGETWAQSKQQVQQENEAFAAGVVASLDNPDVTYANITDAISGYLQNKAAKAEVRYAGVEFKVDSPDKKLLDDWYNLYDALPTVPTSTDWQKVYDAQDAMMATNPRIGILIKQNHQAIFSDPQMKQIMAQIDAAKDVRKQLYAIPAKTGMAPEWQEMLQPLIRELYGYMQLLGMSMDEALRMMGAPDVVASKLRQYLRLPTHPMRKRFKERYADELSWFEAIPFEDIELEPQLAAAGKE